MENVAESIRHVRRTAKEIELTEAALCRTRELRSEAEEAIIYHYIKRQYEETPTKRSPRTGGDTPLALLGQPKGGGRHENAAMPAGPHGGTV